MSSTPCTESHCRHGLSVQVPGFLISELSVSFGVGEAFYCSRSPCQQNGCRSLALHPQSDRLVSFTPCAESCCRHGLPVQVPGFLIQSFPSPRGWVKRFHCSRSPCQHYGCRLVALLPRSDRHKCLPLLVPRAIAGMGCQSKCLGF